MNNFALRMFVRSIIAEAKDKKAEKEPKKEAKKTTKKPEAKKTSGNLVEMKKELADLKEKLSKIDELISDWESIKSSANNMHYGGEQDIEIGADKRDAILEDCDKEIEKLKKEKESIEKEMASLKENTLSEINKIKEMMGLAAPKKKDKEKIVDEEKKPVRVTPDNEVKADKDIPGQGMSEARFKKGTDIGKKGPGFAKIAKSAAKEYGSKEAGKRVAGAILKKVIKKGK